MHHSRSTALAGVLIAGAVLLAGCGASSTASPASGGSGETGMPSMSGMPGMGGMHGMHMGTAADTGTTATAGGYTLQLATATAVPETATTVSFTIAGPDGRPVTDYVVDQTKKLHLYLIRTDLTQFQHVHPTLAADGTWSVRTTFDQPGTYRVVADFVTAEGGTDATHVLGAPLTVSGSWQPRPVPAPTLTTTVDGYTLQAEGTLTAGAESTVTVRITRGGAPVRDLQPYLGVWAHLSAFHAGDLAFAHLHPTAEPGAGGTNPDPLQFVADLPATGTYEVYVQFQTGGVLHTAALTLTGT